jgi:hypothetical protein
VYTSNYFILSSTFLKTRLKLFSGPRAHPSGVCPGRAYEAILVRRALAKASALYVSCEAEGPRVEQMSRFRERQAEAGLAELVSDLTVYTREDIPRLVELIERRL